MILGLDSCFFLPLILAVSVLIKLTSKGPVLYRQERMGLDGRKFTMFKFRTMVLADAEKETGPVMGRARRSEDDEDRTVP